MTDIELIRPEWTVPDSILAFSTTRSGGVSHAPFASLNLADHVGDSAEAVRNNRALLQEQIAPDADWQWLRQVHSNRVLRVESASEPPEADALVCSTRGIVLNILTADCLPLLLCAGDGSEIAAAHCGWRGLASGIVEATVADMQARPGSLLAWLGPAIGPCHFEVGPEVRHEFGKLLPAAALDANFKPTKAHKFMADLYGITRSLLQELGVSQVSGGGWCTHSDPKRFFSFRRDGQCGRMLTSICMQ